MESIINIGSIAFDNIKTPYAQGEKELGGSSVYFSLANSFLSVAKPIAVIGSDFSKKHFQKFEKNTIDTSSIQTNSTGKTFYWEGYYQGDMNIAYTKKIELGVFQNFQPVLSESQKNMEFVFLANIDPDLQIEVIEQLKNPLYVGLDSRNLWIETKKEKLESLLQKIDFLFLNDEEIKLLSNENNIITAAKKILRKGPKYVIVKKGEHGAVLFSKNSILIAPAFPTHQIVDPTGAGDSFAGGFFSYYIANKQKKQEEQLLKESLSWGTVISSFVVEKLGIQAYENLSIYAIEERLKLYKKMIAV